MNFIKKYVCIHGHFYQPPRENPWLEYLEKQDSASPMHDWNERVFWECYAPNSAARVNTSKGEIIEIINNYEFMSFNFGPTILNWLEKYHQGVYQAIINADKKSEKRLGVGNAMAQVYNHLIMPLATYEEKVVQVAWGIKDFMKRFGRKPEGMWLAETAVDLETLRVLYDQGIMFTVLSPFQAVRVRNLSKENANWHDLGQEGIDPRRAYFVDLGQGKKIAVFFYDGQLSKAIAFDGLLENSEKFIEVIKKAFDSQNLDPQIVSLATDGETYGHHKKFGDMALAYALKQLMLDPEYEVLNYGAFLKKFPPTYEVELYEKSSWSCVHGVERWRSDCGCSTSAMPGWNQKWRKPLREALDLVRDALNKTFEKEVKKFFQGDLVKLFIDYFDVFAQDSLIDKKQDFIKRYIGKKLKEEDSVVFFKLLEAKRNALLMYTSCGWFFADISGIETIQIMNYATRVIQILQDFDIHIENEFVAKLSQAKSNLDEYKNGAFIYEKLLKPQIIDLQKVGAHFAISALFEDYADINKIYTYEIECFDFVKESRGINTFSMGHISVFSERTGEKKEFQFAVLHYHEIDFHCSIQLYEGKNKYKIKKESLLEIFRKQYLTDIVQALTNEFGKFYYTLSDVFNEEKRFILEAVTNEEVERLNQMIFYMSQKNKKLIEYCNSQHISVPRPLLIMHEYTYQKVVEHLFSGKLASEDIYKQLKQVMNVVDTFGFKLFLEDQVAEITQQLELLAQRYLDEPVSYERLKSFYFMLKAVKILPCKIEVWDLQNQFYDFFQKKLKTINFDERFKNHVWDILQEIRGLLGISVDVFP